MVCRIKTMDSIVNNSEEFLVLLRVLTKNEDTKDDLVPYGKRKRVRISTEAVTASPPTKRELTRGELRDLWYDAESIQNFKVQGRKLMTTMTPYQQDSIDGTETARGFENATLERQLHRHRTVQSVVSAHRKGMSAGQTATISKRCSKWNRDIAMLQAYRDYLEIYHPGTPLPKVNNEPPKFPFTLRRASDSSSQGAQERRVRRRTRLCMKNFER